MTKKTSPSGLDGRMDDIEIKVVKAPAKKEKKEPKG